MDTIYHAYILTISTSLNVIGQKNPTNELWLQLKLTTDYDFEYNKNSLQTTIMNTTKT